MKSFVKFLGVALLATSMAFVACSKDEDGDTSEATTVDKTPSVTFKFDGKTYSKSELKFIDTYVETEDEWYYYGLQASEDTNTYPYVELEMSRPMGASVFTLDYVGVGSDMGRMFITGDLDWEILWGTEEFKVTEFDPAANRMNISVKATMYDLLEFKSSQNMKEESDCAQKNFEIEAKNIVFGTPTNL